MTPQKHQLDSTQTGFISKQRIRGINVGKQCRQWRNAVAIRTEAVRGWSFAIHTAFRFL